MFSSNNLSEYFSYREKLKHRKDDNIVRKIGLISILVFSSIFVFATPQIINYQGILTDSGGTPIAGSRSVEFKIWNAASGGSLLWTETQNVNVDNGLFSVLLGSVTPIPNTVFASDNTYLSLNVGGTGDMSPRQRLVSVAYAYQADQLDGKEATDFANATHNHNASDINAGTLSVARGGTGIASYTANNYIRASGATTLEQRTPAQVLSDIGAAASSHNHDAGNITTGTLGVARGGTGIASYTTGNYINASGATTLQQRTPAQVLSDIGAAASAHNHDAGNITTGTLGVARGGTGAATFTAGRVLFGNGTSAINTSANLFWDNANSRLGIGTASPGRIYHTYGTTLESRSVTIESGATDFNYSAANLYLKRSRAGAAAGNTDYAGSVKGSIVNSVGTEKEIGSVIFRCEDATSGSEDGSISFHTSTNGTMTEYMRLTNSGFLGIGTGSPGVKLHIEYSVSNNTTPLYVHNNVNDDAADGIGIRIGASGTGMSGENNFLRFYRRDGTQIGRVRADTEATADNVVYATTGLGDFAEYVHTGEITTAGDILTITEQGAIKATGNVSIAGIHSTSPSFVGNDGLNGQDNVVPLALVGMAPLKVSSKNGIIKPGDYITTSDIPGIGQLASEAGPTVGIASEKLEISTAISVHSLEDIEWPEDNGTNSMKPCYQLPDGTYIGKIIAFVHIGWYDPNAKEIALKLQKLEAENTSLKTRLERVEQMLGVQ